MTSPRTAPLSCSIDCGMTCTPSLKIQSFVNAAVCLRKLLTATPLKINWLRPSLHDVERRLGCAPEAAESCRSHHLANARLTRLRPRHSPTSCDREHGVHSSVENEYITRPTGFIFSRLEPFTSHFFNQAGRSHDRFQTGFRNI